MPLVLEDGTGVAGANSWRTAAQADDYFSTRLGSDVWTESSSGNKDAALIQAARDIAFSFDWRYPKAYPVQNLPFPCALSDEQKLVPEEVILAQLEHALYLLQKLAGEDSQTDDGAILTSLAVPGEVSATFDVERPSSHTIPDRIAVLLRGYGSLPTKPTCNKRFRLIPMGATE